MCAKKFKSDTENENCNEQAGVEIGQAQPKAGFEVEI